MQFNSKSNMKAAIGLLLILGTSASNSAHSWDEVKPQAEVKFPFSMPQDARHVVNSNFMANCYNFAYAVATKAKAETAKVESATLTKSLCQEDAGSCQQWADNLALAVEAKLTGKKGKMTYSHWCHDIFKAKTASTASATKAILDKAVAAVKEDKAAKAHPAAAAAKAIEGIASKVPTAAVSHAEKRREAAASPDVHIESKVVDSVVNKVRVLSPHEAAQPLVKTAEKKAEKPLVKTAEKKAELPKQAPTVVNKGEVKMVKQPVVHHKEAKPKAVAQEAPKPANHVPKPAQVAPRKAVPTAAHNKKSQVMTIAHFPEKRHRNLKSNHRMPKKTRHEAPAPKLPKKKEVHAIHKVQAQSGVAHKVAQKVEQKAEQQAEHKVEHKVEHKAEHKSEHTIAVHKVAKQAAEKKPEAVRHGWGSILMKEDDMQEEIDAAQRAKEAAKREQEEAAAEAQHHRDWAVPLPHRSRFLEGASLSQQDSAPTQRSGSFVQKVEAEGHFLAEEAMSFAHSLYERI